MQAAAASAPAPRHRVYTAVEPRCEWARAADADTLVVDVSGFMKEELKVLYNTSRKLKVAGERPVGDGRGARWAKFLKSFPVPRSVRAGGIRAVMDKEQAVLYVILPKGSPPPPPPPPPSSMATQKEPSSMATQKEQQPHGERKGDGSSGSSSNGSFWSAQEDAEKNRAEEKNNMVPKETRIQIQEEEEEIATPDAPRNDGGDDDKRWSEKLTPLHAVGFIVIVLAVLGVGALYATLLL
ncbi:inactive protein RESTRICTED TEV MOVEMENT 2-like [Triticum dicoccoides]|uniref:inactive protein RESTRICTED TEV MOVEMENT 2-like n=1 Tax=Triticum dicoccoides TaxID=85692 RepID=UPI00188FF958|nr:inactive protein RESTRICTED TEV MOVEMENT 2-like [Triticum dicoccoides]